MRTNVPEKLLALVDAVRTQGNVNQTRLIVLKKWFAMRPGRLTALALWVAARAASRKGKTARDAALLFKAARTVLAALDEFRPRLNRRAAQALHTRLRDFQNEYDKQQWGAVRIIKNWDLFVVEQALAVCLWYPDSAERGYKLTADHLTHYDARYGKGLNGPSAAKLAELTRFLATLETREEDDDANA